MSDNKEARDTEAELAEAIDILVDVVWQAAGDGNGRADSCALGAYAAALHFLSERGFFAIEAEFGRRVIGKFTEAARK